MISDPPSFNPPRYASSPSDSSPRARLGENHQDVNHVFDDGGPARPLHTRGSERRDFRATDLLSLPELAELENYLRDRIRDRPLSTLALGAASGAVVSLLRPLLGKAPAALVAALAMRAGRRLLWQAAERTIHNFLTPDELEHAPSQAP